MADNQDSQSDATGRPSVLLNASETQIEELERQFNEHDRSTWDTLTESYGWTLEESNAVWQWYGERPTAGQGWPSA